MNFLTRLWPFRGGDVATALTDDDFASLQRRAFRHSKLFTAPDLPFVLIPPIPLSERQPKPSDLGGIYGHCCWWGYWQGDYWLWIWDSEPVRGETHWLPATAGLLPARCCPPEAGQ